jgi:membrane fusion protein, multidrug efflux system
MMDGSQFVGPIGPGEEVSTAKRRGRNWSLRWLLMALTIPLLLVGSILYGHYYWTVGRFLVSTSDAYVQAHSVIISPQVSGYIVAVLVDDNQQVHAGEVLARIDPSDYQTASAGARANVDAAQASIDNFQQQIAEQNLQVEEASAAVTGGVAGSAWRWCPQSPACTGWISSSPTQTRAVASRSSVPPVSRRSRMTPRT